MATIRNGIGCYSDRSLFDKAMERWLPKCRGDPADRRDEFARSIARQACTNSLKFLLHREIAN